MNTFKSWLVANLEVILIIFSLILFIAGVVKCIHAPDEDSQGVWAAACLVIAVICGLKHRSIPAIFHKKEKTFSRISHW